MWLSSLEPPVLLVARVRARWYFLFHRSYVETVSHSLNVQEVVARSSGDTPHNSRQVLSHRTVVTREKVVRRRHFNEIRIAHMAVCEPLEFSLLSEEIEKRIRELKALLDREITDFESEQSHLACA